MNKTALEEEILGEVNKLKRLWGIEEPLRLSGGFYQNYCNLSVTNRKLRKKKRQTWGRAHSETRIPAGNRNRMVVSI